MRKLILPLLLCIFSTTVFSQNTGSISGTITDKQTNEPLEDATVTVKGTLNSVTSNNEGNFILKVNAGKIILEISYVGYVTIELTADVTDGSSTTVNAALSLDNRVGSEIVVSASKRREKITNAPTSIRVISAKDLAQFPGSNVGELMSKLQGVEFTRSGVDDITFNARGFHSAFNNKVFQLVDGRNSIAAASGGISMFNNGSINKDDIERIEIVLGPQTALYGPNAHNALFNYITKDPRRYQGTTISVSAGSQYQFSARFRHATKINNKWAYKLTGEHTSGQDYKWYDSVYAGNQPPAFYIGNQPPAGTTPFFGDAIAIPERIHDFTFRRYKGEAHVYYSITPKADIIVSGGGSKFTRLQTTTGIHNQLRDFTYGFLQAKFVLPRFFANIYNTWNNLGKSINIGNYTRDFWNSTHDSRGRLFPDEAEKFATRLGNTFKERSQRLNAELQYNYDFKKKAGLFMVAGVNYQNERPNGYGIGLVDSFQSIRITQYGAVLQLEKSLPWSTRLISATRFDHHNNFGNFFAPRFALVKAIGDGNFRITWGRAYSMPSILNQYAGINRSLFGNGAGIKYIPTGAKFSDPASITYTTSLKPEQVNTWEVGYKGTISKKFFIDINYYNGSTKNFISPTRSVSGRALAVGDIEVIHSQPTAGKVENDTLKGASFMTFFNYAEVRAYGLDVGLNYAFSKFVNLAVKYSWFGSDITKDDLKNDANNDDYVSLEEKSLNAPNHRGAVMVNFQNLCKEKLFVGISARYVQEYDFYSGSQIGTAIGKGSRGIVFGGMRKTPNGSLPSWYLKNFDHGALGGFVTIDLNAGYRFSKMVSGNMGITNLFNTTQIEFSGSPSIGRLIMFELKVQVPNNKKLK